MASTKHYDSFRVSAIFSDGITKDNDIIYDTGADAIFRELVEAYDWFKDQNPEDYMISYYLDGECIYSELWK